MRANFEITTALQYENRELKRKLAGYESGEEYRRIEEKYDRECDALLREKAALKAENASLRREHRHMTRKWFEVFEDIEAAYRKELAAKDREIARLKMEKLASDRTAEAERGKRREKQRELYAVQTKLEEAEGLIKKLTAQVNRDFENSSLPSSMQGPRRRKIVNSRERSGKKPGGQPGHKGARRERHEPDHVVHLDPPACVIGDPDYYKTEQTVTKQLVMLRVSAETVEYVADVYRNRRTGARVHAGFPEGLCNDVTYDGTVKAFMHLLCTECNVSVGKARRFLSELTGGALKPSAGMINGLCREFSEKTAGEKKEIISRLMTSPVMNADFTTSNVNGKTGQVLILASPSQNAALFIARESKGHKGVQGTPLESYMGTVAHDHDMTFYSYGLRHQECQQHNLRYAKGSIQNEPGLAWNTQMQALIREMVHYRNTCPGHVCDPSEVARLEAEYDRILELAVREYEYEPPGEYYREGYNLAMRLKEFRESQLLFLHDPDVPADNSLCERLARVYKRKQKQAIVMRSEEAVGYLCDAMSIVYCLRSEGRDVYREVGGIFNRPATGKKPGNRFKKAGV